MGNRQVEKSNTTRKELSDAMVHLFLEKGYDNTTIKDIAERAGYSVGSFYRHWKSKSQAFMEYWDGYVADFIKGSVENAPGGSIQQMIAFLIERSDKFSRNEITIKLYMTSTMLSVQYDYHDLTSWSERFSRMLYDYIKEVSSCKDEQRLLSTACILNTILNTHAMRYANNILEGYCMDNETMAICLKAIIRSLDEG